MNIILACDKNYGIGINNQLPWNLKDDMIHFKKTTVGKKNNVVIMGKNTYLSLKNPLPNRTNFVVSKTLFHEIANKYNINNNDIIYYNNFTICNDFVFATSHAKEMCNLFENTGEIWIIGGAKLYEHVISNYDINKAIITIINDTFNCDVYLEKNTIQFINNCNWSNITNKEENNYFYSINEYSK